MASNYKTWWDFEKSHVEIKLIQLSIYINYLYIEVFYNINIVNNSFILYLDDNGYENIFTLFENIKYPPNTDTIIIIVNVDYLTKYMTLSLSKLKIIKLLNLPEKLSHLKITSSIPFDLSNLPTNLISLDISNSGCKFNLDYLPDSLKILYLPSFFLHVTYVDWLKYLTNLPLSLIEIKCGYIVYNSVGELIKNYMGINNF